MGCSTWIAEAAPVVDEHDGEHAHAGLTIHVDVRDVRALDALEAAFRRCPHEHLLRSGVALISDYAVGLHPAPALEPLNVGEPKVRHLVLLYALKAHGVPLRPNRSPLRRVSDGLDLLEAH